MCAQPKMGHGGMHRKVRHHVVAWINKTEWDQVLEELYCKDCERQRAALDRISAWKSRYGRSMPFAVECTADLVRCRILDVTNRTGPDELVLVYGLALVRFVNLITERKQKMMLVPLRRLANEMNIPEWIVNLRHDFTHRTLPNLNWCRKGFDFVMEWLRKEYWSRQLGGSLFDLWELESSEEDDEDSDDDFLNMLSSEEKKHLKLVDKTQNVLLSYMKNQYKILADFRQLSMAKKAWNVPSYEVEWIIDQTKDLIKEDCEVVAEVFLHDGFLIPASDQLRTLNIDCEDDQDLLNLRIPRTVYRFWQPLLKGLHSQTFTQMLLEKLFAELRLCCTEPAIEIRPQFLVCWISEMLMANKRAGKNGKKITSLQQEASSNWKLFPHKVNLEWKTLLNKCLEAPCQATPHLLQRLLRDMKPKMPLDTQEKLMYLCSIYAQGGECFSSSASLAEYREQPIYTVESLQWKTKQDPQAKVRKAKTVDLHRPVAQKDKTMDTQKDLEEYLQLITAEEVADKRAALQGSAWRIDGDDVKWSKIPLGKVLGQDEDPDCLVVDSYSTMSILDQTITGEQSIIPPRTSVAEFRASEGLFWTQSDLHRIKTGIELF